MDVTDADAQPVVSIWTRFVVRGDHEAGAA
jgi:hypothetical protein